jgi:hypothetical protein
MTTTTTTTIPTEPVVQSFYVSAEHEGFAFDPDEAIGFAVADLLVVQSTGFDAVLAAARKLAAADEASALSRPERARFASLLMVDHPTRPDYVLSMSASTYSKRVRVGRATDDEVLAFLMACDTPSLDKLYNALPKAEHLAKAKGTGRRAAKAEPVEPESVVSQSETVGVADSDVPKIAADVLAGLHTRGLTRVQIGLLIAELDRLTTPVRSVA